TVSLNGSASDDGLPSGILTVAWSKESGPGTVTFDPANAAATTARFSTSGTYVLQLGASDTVLSSTSRVTVTVNPAAPVNQAPVVNAGADQTIPLPASATLAGTVTDDGLPNPPGAVTIAWSVVSGPGAVTFDNAGAAATTASFAAPGAYVLRLTG